MKFLSLQQLWVSFLNVCRRFSFPIIYAIIATVCALASTGKFNHNQFQQYYIKGIYLGNFGLVLSLALCLYTEINQLVKAKFYAINGLIIVILLLIYYFVDPYRYNSDIILLLILGFAFHLLVAFSAFTSKQENNGFWQINKNFFLQFATSALYSGVLFVGLSIAILSTNTLFNLKLDERIYFRLWIFMVGIFNTVFFLSGISQPLEKLNQDISYPKGLKIFTQYVLIPLASIYLAILLAYEIKIVVQWSLPQSSVAILILGYAVFGILSILLVHPIRNEEGNKWINLFSKSFYLLMLPLLLLLAASIYKRVADYGITESRYLIIAMALWLTFITIYFLIKGREQIRLIPISLCIISLFIIIGPWGIKVVSKSSQQERLTAFLAKKSSPKRNNQIRDITRYLYDHFGLLSLQPFIKSDVLAIEKHFEAKLNKKEYGNWEVKGETQDSLLTLLKVDPSYEITEGNGLLISQERTFDNQENGVFEVIGALKIVEFNSNMNNQDKKNIPFYLDKDQFMVTIDTINRINISTKNGEKITFDSNDLLKKLLAHKEFKGKKTDIQRFDVPNSLMLMQQNLKNYTFVCRFERINGGYKTKAGKQISNIYFNGFIIIYPKNKDQD